MLASLADSDSVFKTGTLTLFLRGAVRMSESVPLIISAFEDLHKAIKVVYLRGEVKDGGRISVAAARHFKSLGQEAAALSSFLVAAEASVSHLQQSAGRYAEEGQTRLALTAINDLYCSVMNIYPRLRKTDTKIDKILVNLDNPIRLELEKIDFAKAVASWKVAYDDILKVSAKPAWVAEPSEPKEASAAEAELPE